MSVDWLFLNLGFTNYDEGEKDNGRRDEKSYSDPRALLTFFLGFHIVTTGNVFLFLYMIQKRKNI
jgi:hypothetical protein